MLYEYSFHIVFSILDNLLELSAKGKCYQSNKGSIQCFHLSGTTVAFVHPRYVTALARLVKLFVSIWRQSSHPLMVKTKASARGSQEKR